MKKVWELNMYQRGYAEFWDYWSAVKESASIVVAFNEIKRSKLSEDTDSDVAEALIASYIYDTAESGKRKLDTKPIKSLITQIGTLEFSSGSWSQITKRECLKLLKSVIYKKQPKMYQKCRELVESAL